MFVGRFHVANRPNFKIHAILIRKNGGYYFLFERCVPSEHGMQIHLPSTIRVFASATDSPQLSQVTEAKILAFFGDSIVIFSILRIFSAGAWSSSMVSLCIISWNRFSSLFDLCGFVLYLDRHFILLALHKAIMTNSTTLSRSSRRKVKVGRGTPSPSLLLLLYPAIPHQRL